MKIFEIIIKPISGFGTLLKGDTLFGHFCWQIAYDSNLAQKSLEELLTDYSTKPFVIFSSAYPKISTEDDEIYAFKRPELPLEFIFNMSGDKSEIIKQRKELKKRRWMLIKKGQKTSSLRDFKYESDEKLISLSKGNLTEQMRQTVRSKETNLFIAPHTQFHNTINRLTGTTGEDNFAPFSVQQEVFYPKTELAIFVGIEEAMITIDQIKTGLKRIGEMGFGKDASTGLGKFTLAEDMEISLSELGNDKPNACYILSPSVPQKDTFVNMFFSPFIRFGKHGDVQAKSKNPFKNPIIMADEGAILIPKNQEILNKPYIGMAISNLSKVESKTVAQGYSLYIPVNYLGDAENE